MRPSRDEMDTEYWLKARAYWTQKADKYASWNDRAGFDRCMTRAEQAAHEFSRARQISECGCMANGCNYRNA